MTSENMWARIRRQPFTPFRLNTSDGKGYEIAHPEMIKLSKNNVTVYFYESGADPESDLPAREIYISPLHVASLEDLPARV